MKTGQLKDNDKIALFESIFTGRTDVYGTYDPGSGKCRQVKGKVDKTVILDHLCGHRPFGLYPLVGGHTKILAIDFDDESLEVAVDCVSKFLEYEFETYIEVSKSKGYHVWLFFDEPVLAANARVIAKKVLTDIDKPDAEIFPKQDKLDSNAAYGNFINAPLFGKLAIEGRTVFLDYDNMPNPCDDQWEFLGMVKKYKNRSLELIIDKLDLTTQPPYIAGGNSDGNRFGLVPCAKVMLENGVDSFQRVSCYRLAVRLRQLGLPFDIALAALNGWSQKNRPAGGKRIITPKEIQSQTLCAYKNNNTGFGCSDPAVSRYCDKNCPVHRFKTENK